jgi:hypothetical protein
VADVAGRVSLAGQIALIAGLRWKILRNHLRRKNNVLDLIGMIGIGLCAGAVIVCVSFAFYFGAHTALSTGHPEWLTLLFLGIIVFWQILPIFVAGFGVNFEFRTLLRFPLSLAAFYLISLTYGLADFVPIASLCWLLAMTVGVGTANAEALPAMILIVTILSAMSLTLERLVGSWLERLLAKRVTRELFLGLVILLSVSAQFIRPLLEHYRSGPPPIVLRMIPYLPLTPPVLAGHAVQAALQHNVGGVVLRAAGLCVFLLVFSALLWRRFAAQYRGEELSEASAPSRAIVRAEASTPGAPDALSFLSAPVAAVLKKEFHYLVRNAFLLMSLLMPPFLVFLFGSQFGGQHPWALRAGVSTDLFFPGMIGYLLLMLMMPVYNCFAYEGKGIQTYFTAPMRFRDVFLGKNLLHVGILSFELSVSVSVLVWRIGMPSLPVFVASLIGAVFAAAGQFAVANWASLCFPRKLEYGSMRGQHGSGVAIWVGFGSQILLGGVGSLVLFMGRWMDNPWLPAEAFVVLAAASVAGYFASLDGLSALAEKKKENLIQILCR